MATYEDIYKLTYVRGPSGIEAAAQAWNEAWAISPPERPATPSFPTADQSRDLQRHQTESDSAHEGLEAVAKALDRLNKLERTIVA